MHSKIYWISYSTLGANAPYDDVLRLVEEIPDQFRDRHQPAEGHYPWTEHGLPAFTTEIFFDFGEKWGGLPHLWINAARRLNEAGIEYGLVCANKSWDYRIWRPGDAYDEPLTEIPPVS